MSKAIQFQIIQFSISMQFHVSSVIFNINHIFKSHLVIYGKHTNNKVYKS